MIKLVCYVAQFSSQKVLFVPKSRLGKSQALPYLGIVGSGDVVEQEHDRLLCIQMSPNAGQPFLDIQVSLLEYGGRPLGVAEAYIAFVFANHFACQSPGYCDCEWYYAF